MNCAALNHNTMSRNYVIYSLFSLKTAEKVQELLDMRMSVRVFFSQRIQNKSDIQTGLSLNGRIYCNATSQSSGKNTCQKTTQKEIQGDECS